MTDDTVMIAAMRAEIQTLREMTRERCRDILGPAQVAWLKECEEMRARLALADALCFEVSLVVDRNTDAHDCIVDPKDIAALRISRDDYRNSKKSTT